MTEQPNAMAPLHWSKIGGEHIAHGDQFVYMVRKNWGGDGRNDFRWQPYSRPVEPEGNLSWYAMNMQYTTLKEAKSHCRYHNECLRRGVAVDNV